MILHQDKRRIFIFLAFAFGIAWMTGLVIALTGGLQNSPQLAPGVSLALVLLASVYMWAPAIAHILTRLITHEGWSHLGLRPNFKRGWRFWAAAWVLPALATVAGAALFFLLFPQYYGGLAQVGAMYMIQGVPVPPNLAAIIAMQLLIAVAISPLLNCVATFGEEFGWRAYLQPKLMPLGPRRAILILGVIWGIWHWPVIAMGYEYGFSYPGFPWVGMLLFILVTISLGSLLGWVTIRGGSVWPAVIGHAAINGIAGAAAIFTYGQPSSLLGPLPVGIVGMMGYLALALVILFSRSALTPVEAAKIEPAPADGVTAETAPAEIVDAEAVQAEAEGDEEPESEPQPTSDETDETKG